MIITKLEPYTLEEIAKKNKIILESLAMDLKRVALGYHRGSYTMANRFSQEAFKRKNELDISQLKPYMKKIITTLEITLLEADKQKAAEDSLMFSTLIQNYTGHFL